MLSEGAATGANTRTHHTLSIDTWVVSLTDVGDLSASCGAVAITLVARGTGADGGVTA